MKKLRCVSFIVAMFAVFGVYTLSAHAELIIRGTDSLGNQLIYDSDLNITWYDYTRPRSDFESNRDWASNLTVNLGGSVYDDWRLPACLVPNSYYACYGELYRLFEGSYTRTYPVVYTRLDKFQHLGDSDPSNFYPWFWYGDTRYNPGSGNVWAHTGFGGESLNYSSQQYSAIAVRDGDVAVVPEPISFVLFVFGGALLVGKRFLKKRNGENYANL